MQRLQVTICKKVPLPPFIQYEHMILIFCTPYTLLSDTTAPVTLVYRLLLYSNCSLYLTLNTKRNIIIILEGSKVS